MYKDFYIVKIYWSDGAESFGGIFINEKKAIEEVERLTSEGYVCDIDDISTITDII